MESLKKKIEEEKARLAKNKEDYLEKRKDAEAAFLCWTNKKNELMKDEGRQKGKVKAEEGQKEKDATSEEKEVNARVAYESWLEELEKRDEEEKEREEEERERLKWMPPWYPVGSRNIV